VRFFSGNVSTLDLWQASRQFEFRRSITYNHGDPGESLTYMATLKGQWISKPVRWDGTPAMPKINVEGSTDVYDKAAVAHGLTRKRKEREQ